VENGIEGRISGNREEQDAGPAEGISLCPRGLVSRQFIQIIEAGWPVSEITKAELVRNNLQIKRRGKWRRAISVRSDKVPDVLGDEYQHVLLRL